MRIQPGERFGRYEIRAGLGAGAMGEVFRAYDPRLDREVALKLIAADLERHPRARARFEQEARAASALNHPNIVTVHDLGEEEGRLFIVMELLEGQSLRNLLTGPLPLDLLLRLATQIADALSAAHERGIIHRDLKPENIFVTREGAAKVLDFGLARIYESEREQSSLEQTVDRLTKRGVVLGTLGYSAPEALSGSIVNRGADVFSFGVILYEMACGFAPFRGATAAEILAATLRDEPPSSAAHRPDLPSPVARVISRCLAKDPSSRYSRTWDLRDDLRAALATGAESPKARGPRSPLPAAKTPLIGRDAELRQVISLIADDGVRLLTLTGPGGSGKTRLALATAQALLPRFHGEVFFVPLATIHDPTQVSPAIAGSMRVSLVPGQSALAAVTAEINMTGSPALLVLDNFEQVIEAAKEVSELLAACPMISVLITSREVLHLYGEHDVPVPPLPVPNREAELSTEALARVPAVALFVERARAVDATFRLTAEASSDVAEICRRLDGLPLALELAAARVRMLAPRALLARLEQRLPLLTTGARDLPDRQHTLRRTIDWSYELLTPAEQVLFRRLGVFVGGCTLEAAEAVADPFGKLGAMVDDVASLVDKSLLHKQEDEGGELRFAMLETIREYATNVLHGTEDEQPTRRAHAAYFLILAEEGARVLAREESPQWLARFAREHDNFRAALDWLTAVRDSAWGLRMGVALFYFWERADHLIEGRRRITTLLDLPAAEADDPMRARALHAAGVLAAALRDSREAIRLTESSLDLYRQVGDQSGMAVSRNALGIAFTELGELDRAAEHLEAALVDWQAVGNQSGYARSLSNLAFVRRVQRRYDEARRLHVDAALMFERLGDRLSSAWALNHQGDIARDQTLWTDATKLYQSALENFRRLKDDWGAASSMADLGTVARQQGDVAGAEAWYRQALESFSRLGHRRGVARVLESMAVLAAQIGSHERALTLAGAAAQLRQKIGAPAPITDQAELSQWIEAARGAVNAQASQQAQRRGSGMSLVEAVRYAENP